jgi:hypothetical protein
MIMGNGSKLFSGTGVAQKPWRLPPTEEEAP